MGLCGSTNDLFGVASGSSRIARGKPPNRLADDVFHGGTVTMDDRNCRSTPWRLRGQDRRSRFEDDVYLGAFIARRVDPAGTRCPLIDPHQHPAPGGIMLANDERQLRLFKTKADVTRR